MGTAVISASVLHETISASSESLTTHRLIDDTSQLSTTSAAQFALTSVLLLHSYYFIQRLLLYGSSTYLQR